MKTYATQLMPYSVARCDFYNRITILQLSLPKVGNQIENERERATSDFGIIHNAQCTVRCALLRPRMAQTLKLNLNLNRFIFLSTLHHGDVKRWF